MRHTTAAIYVGLLLSALGCGQTNPRSTPAVDCSVADAYDFRNITEFSGKPGWFSYADNTPGGVATMDFKDPGRCGDPQGMELRAHGHNFYGAGFGDYEHNAGGSRADGSGYEGISFWARSPGNTDKTFMLYVDDGRTIVMSADMIMPGVDNDGDGVIGAGDIAAGTSCRLPPDQSLGRAACYYGGVLPPATPPRVPAPDECGNQFHTYVTTTENWQLILIPWSQLVQWPCPNRLDGGIEPSDIAKFEIKLLQGTNYDIWLDNIAFYKLRTDAGG